MLCATAILLAVVGAEQCRPSGSNHDAKQKADSVRVTGRTVVLSDVGTIPDAPLQALVLSIHQHDFLAFLDSTGYDIPRDSVFSRLHLSLTSAQFDELVVAHSRSNEQGDYEFTIQPGVYYFCLANLSRSERTTTVPCRVYGAIEVEIPEENDCRQNIYWGEAGVTSR